MFKAQADSSTASWRESGRTRIISDRVRTSRKPSDRPRTPQAESRASREGYDGSELKTRATSRKRSRWRDAAEEGAGNEEGNPEYTKGTVGEVKGKKSQGGKKTGRLMKSIKRRKRAGDCSNCLGD